MRARAALALSLSRTPATRRQEIRLFDDSVKLTQPLRSLSCWPLVAGKKFIGAFFIGSIKANAFSSDDRAFLDTLMNQVAVVMDNAILHRQIRNMAHHRRPDRPA